MDSSSQYHKNSNSIYTNYDGGSECTSSTSFVDDSGDGCSYPYDTYTWYCDYDWYWDGSANGDPNTECCGCGGVCHAWMREFL